MTSLVVLTAGLRSPSSTRLLADELTAATQTALTAEGVTDTATTVVEVREHAHGLADALLTGFATGALREALDAVAAADALIVVTPTFSGSYSGLFKSFLDVLEPGSLTGTPVLLAATGGSERHSLMLDHALRPLLSYLKARPVTTGVFAATADFGGEGAPRLAARVRQAAAELAAEVARTGPRGRHPEGEAEVIDFAELLRR